MLDVDKHNQSSSSSTTTTRYIFALNQFFEAIEGKYFYVPTQSFRGLTFVRTITSPRHAIDTPITNPVPAYNYSYRDSEFIVARVDYLEHD